ncbi:MAG: DnaB-like helicase C-terminal domain-containing protein [Tannerellaceae bacterium]|jgi:replicative DNA helicase|nr:DnaB-like helicase C-terminal domain-containing protein [Tannerellaceae bacterium]
MTRELQQKIEDLIARYRQDGDEAVINHLKKLLYEDERFAANDAIPVAELVGENLRRLKTDAPRGDVFNSGFQQLDSVMGGFLPGEFIVVGGRPAMGKTTFLVDLSLNISKTVPLLFVSLDFPGEQLANRFIASLSEVPIRRIQQGTMSEAEWERIDAVEKAFAGRRLFVLDNRNNAISAIKAHCEKQISENGVKVIVVDYLQLISSSRRWRQRVDEVSLVSRELKNMAREHNVCVIASSSLNRGPEYRIGIEGKHPQLADLRESGAIEQDADKVIMVHRPEYYRISEDEKGNSLIGIAEFIVAKNRNGATGDVRLLFEAGIPAFKNLAGVKEDFAFSPERLKELDGKLPF